MHVKPLREACLQRIGLGRVSCGECIGGRDDIGAHRRLRWQWADAGLGKERLTDDFNRPAEGDSRRRVRSARRTDGGGAGGDECSLQRGIRAAGHDHRVLHAQRVVGSHVQPFKAQMMAVGVWNHLEVARFAAGAGSKHFCRFEDIRGILGNPVLEVNVIGFGSALVDRAENVGELLSWRHGVDRGTASVILGVDSPIADRFEQGKLGLGVNTACQGDVHDPGLVFAHRYVVERVVDERKEIHRAGF